MSLKEQAYWQNLEDYHNYCRMMEKDFDEEEFYSNDWQVA